MEPTSSPAPADRPSRRLSANSVPSSVATPTISTSTTDVSASKSATSGILRQRRSADGSSSEAVDPPPSAANKPTMCDEDQKKQDRKVCILRGAMIATLVSATVVVAALTYVYVSRNETLTFEDQYRDSVSKVGGAFQERLDSKHYVAQTFSAIYTSRYGNKVFDPPIWPNATMPDFQEIAEGQLKLANGRAMSFNPIITQDVDRVQWEAHAVESADILGEPTLIEPEEGTEWPDNRTVAFGIYTKDPVTKEVISDPGNTSASVYPSVLVPVWQIAPIDTNSKAVMFNLHSEPNRMRALDDMLTYHVETLTATLQLVQDVELRPSAILFAPVFDEFNTTYVAREDKTAVGSISVVFSWDDMLRSILPNYIKGIICILKSSIGQTYSYSISGDYVKLLGEGDLHDPKYEEFGRTFNANLEGTDESYGVVDYLITYSLTMYPSQEFEDQYVTKRPAIYTACVVLIFVCTAGLFFLYDHLVENRQQKTARLARQTSNIVDSMFPASFRDRLYKSNAAPPAGAQRKTERLSVGSVTSEANVAGIARRQSQGTQDTHRASNTTPARALQPKRFSMDTAGLKHLQINKFMKRSSDQNLDLAHAPGSGEGQPIADLFLDTSIMFSDIVGFTKWSSERSPHQVFELLEHLFWEFDDIAARLNVFKLGTIGDCYIAVTGIPDPIDDHATVLTQFAFECREKVKQVCAELEAEGLDTAKLDMRFGIHSGAITAGILRGTKSRFELFGDTINTASRMESTGKAGKIQVSEETAELLRMDNMGSWLKKREEKIMAKGKGELQTYWAEPVDKRISFTWDNDDFLTAEMLESHSVTDPQLSEKYFNAEYENGRGDIEYDVPTADGIFGKDLLDEFIPRDDTIGKDPLDEFIPRDDTIGKDPLDEIIPRDDLSTDSA